MSTTHPATVRAWLGVALALGVLGAGLTLIAHDHQGWELVWRTAAAFALGGVAAAVWWAVSFLSGYGVHLPNLPTDDPPPPRPPAAS